MYCPGCGLNNTTQTLCCARCGANLSTGADKLSDRTPDRTAVAEWTGILLKKYYTGRRDTIAGLLLLAGGFVIMRVLSSTGMPPFIAFLWTCWIFFWGVISLAEGASKWLASHDQIKVLGRHISRGSEEEGVMLTEETATAFERPAENRFEGNEVRSESWQADRQRGMMS